MEKISKPNMYEIDQRLEKTLTRNERTTLAQTRTGHSQMFQAYKKRIDFSDNGSCDSREEEEETRDHIFLDCAALHHARFEILGEHFPQQRE